MTRGYELDASAKDANARANQSSVELERATTREIANQERIAELRTRAAAGSAELEQARLHLQGLIVERESHRSFLENAAAEAAGVREESRQRQEQARDAVRGGQRSGTAAGGCAALCHAVAHPGRAMRATRPCMRRSR